MRGGAERLSDRVCCNCRHNQRCELPEDIQCFCEIDGRWMGYVETMTGWCKHWASDEMEWKDDTGRVGVRKA